MKKIIGISGKARSGKDTIASYLWEVYGFTRIAFADPMKQAAQHIFGLSNEQTWGDRLKEEAIPYWGMSPRQMFQLLGNEAIKPTFGDDHWIKRWKISYNVLKATDDIVVPDVRFEHEAAALREMGGIVIHISRGAAPAVNAHASEAGIPFLAEDYAVENNGTIADLYERIDHILEATK